MTKGNDGKAIINFAHRGASGYCPENTMAAFTKGLELGATGIETDVQMTSDGRLVLIHDETVDRTTNGTGYVKDITFEQLRTKDAGAWFSTEFQGESIPSVEELFELVKSSDTLLNLELKNSILPYHGMEEKLVQSIRENGMVDQVLISSFNHYSLAYMKQLAPDIKTAVLYATTLYEPWVYAAQIGVSALHAHYRAVTAEWVAAAREHGVVYNPWTVNDEAGMRHLIDIGVAGIITDYPDRLAALLQG